MTSAALLPHLRAARELIDRDYAAPLDLDRLAAEAACSRHHFLRAFKAAYGETPGAYLTRRRVERAPALRDDLLTVGAGRLPDELGEPRAERPQGREPHLEADLGHGEGRRPQQVLPPPIPGCFVLMRTRPHGSSNPGEAPGAGRT